MHTPGHTAGMLLFLVGDRSEMGVGGGGRGQGRSARSAAPGGVDRRRGRPCSPATPCSRGSVGGVRAPGHTSYTDLRDSIMGTLMELPARHRHHPGHADPTTVAREWDETGSSASGGAWTRRDPTPARRWASRPRWSCSARDYDGGKKAWVRWAEGKTTSCRVPRSSPQPDGSATGEVRSTLKLARESEKIPTSRGGAPRPSASSRRARPSSSSGHARRTSRAPTGIRGGVAAASWSGQAGRGGARDDEGRRDEARPGDELPGRRDRAGGAPRGVPAELGKLRDAAPTVSFKQMRKVIEEDLKRRSGDLLLLRRGADRGRVDRAGLPGEVAEDGREVAVKVQSPAWRGPSGRTCRTWA